MLACDVLTSIWTDVRINGPSIMMLAPVRSTNSSVYMLIQVGGGRLSLIAVPVFGAFCRVQIQRRLFKPATVCWLVEPPDVRLKLSQCDGCANRQAE